MATAGASAQNKAHMRWNTSTGFTSKFSADIRTQDTEFTVPHVALLHTIDDEDAAFRQYNSCVEFTFRERGSSNARKLKQLNTIFEKAADKVSGGIREDHLIKLLPPGSTGKFGLRGSPKHAPKPYRFVSRGTFLVMFSNEAASFIFTMTQNIRLLKGSKMPGTKEKRGKSLPIELEEVLARELRLKMKIRKSKKKSKNKRKISKKNKKGAQLKKELSMVRERTDEECSHSDCSEIENPYVLVKDIPDFTRTNQDMECSFFGNFSNALKKLFPFGVRTAIVPYKGYG